MKGLILFVATATLAATHFACAISVPLSIEKREEVCGNFQEYYTPEGDGQTFYVDPDEGNDDYAGSNSAPFKTLKYAIEQASTHDVIVLADGNYGNVRLAASTSKGYSSIPVATGFTDWVTIIAAPGATPTFDSMSIGAYRVPCPQDVPYDDQVADCQDNGSIRPLRDRFFRELPDTDLYLRFVGITVVNGVDIRGVRNVDIFHSTLQNIGDGEFRVNVENPSIFSSNTQFVTVGCNDITNTHIGVKITDRDYHLFANEIHDNSHDGISLNGGDRVVIESNSIHDLDDGVGDHDFICYEEPTHKQFYYTIPAEKIAAINVVEPINNNNVYTLPEGEYTENEKYKTTYIDENGKTKNLPQTDPSYDHCNYLDSNNRCCTNIRSWNMHVDGMQQYMVKNKADSKWAETSKHVTIRNNLFYHLESMGIMMNGTHGPNYESWTIENNLFGPVGGTMVHLGAAVDVNFTFRHNTVLYAPNDYFISPWREEEYKRLIMDGYVVKHWDTDTGPHLHFYNNILKLTRGVVGPTYGWDYEQDPADRKIFEANNIYIGTRDRRLLAKMADWKNDAGEVLEKGRTVWRGEIEVSTPPYPEITGTIDEYLESGNLPQITAASIARNFGRRQYPSDDIPMSDDFLGRDRGQFPDAGALQYMGDEIFPGDVNGDGGVDLKDVITPLQVNIGLDVNVNSDADINGDEKIGIAEAIDNISELLEEHVYFVD